MELVLQKVFKSNSTEMGLVGSRDSQGASVKALLSTSFCMLILKASCASSGHSHPRPSGPNCSGSAGAWAPSHHPSLPRVKWGGKRGWVWTYVTVEASPWLQEPERFRNAGRSVPLPRSHWPFPMLCAHPQWTQLSSMPQPRWHQTPTVLW